MSKEEYEIEIRPNGEVSVRTIGIKGTACVDAAKQFVKMLQGTELEETHTNEFYEHETNSVENQNQAESWNRWE
ncbi:MAG: DUF2997 domain-containing protein [Planctomycetaceae bacterium]|jgi:hypothetical protein|nr:DUF2997 domain-containing protein [Planctomycetaceae bacterium]